jgi:hypothetical protein
MTDWWINFILPLIIATFLLSIIIGLIFIVSRAFYKKWSRQWKFVIKYNLSKRKPKDEVVQWCIDAIEKGMNYYDAKRFLLLKGLESDKIYETMFIFKKIYKQLKGGANGRITKGSYPKIEGSEFHDV